MRKRFDWQAVGRSDPRHYQITALAFLLLFGLVRLRLDVELARSAAILITVLVAQFSCGQLWKLPMFDVRSALISGLSLCLLLRTNSTALAGATAVAAIISKFIFRWNGKHLFNPTNFGLIFMMIASHLRAGSAHSGTTPVKK